MAKEITEKESRDPLLKSLDVADEIAEFFEDRGYDHPAETIGGISAYVATVIETNHDPHEAFLLFEQAVSAMREILRESKKQKGK